MSPFFHFPVVGTITQVFFFFFFLPWAASGYIWEWDFLTLISLCNIYCSEPLFLFFFYATGILVVFLLPKSRPSPGCVFFPCTKDPLKHRICILPPMGGGSWWGRETIQQAIHYCKVWGLYFCRWWERVEASIVGTSVPRGTGPRPHCCWRPVTYIFGHQHTCVYLCCGCFTSCRLKGKNKGSSSLCVFLTSFLFSFLTWCCYDFLHYAFYDHTCIFCWLCV